MRHKPRSMKCSCASYPSFSPPSSLSSCRRGRNSRAMPRRPKGSGRPEFLGSARPAGAAVGRGDRRDPLPHHGRFPAFRLPRPPRHPDRLRHRPGAQAICAVLSVQCAMQARPFETLVDGLKDGTGNAIIAGFDADRARAAEAHRNAGLSEDPRPLRHRKGMRRSIPARRPRRASSASSAAARTRPIWRAIFPTCMSPATAASAAARGAAERPAGAPSSAMRSAFPSGCTARNRRIAAASPAAPISTTAISAPVSPSS